MYTITITDKELSYILMALGVNKAKANQENNLMLGHEISQVMSSVRNQVRAMVEANG